MAQFSIKIPVNHPMTWEERIELFELFCTLNNCTIVTHSYQPGYVEMVCQTKDPVDLDAYLNDDGPSGPGGIPGDYADYIVRGSSEE